MSGFRVMAAFAAGATIAGMVVGVARLTDVVEPATAVADSEAGTPEPVANTTGSLEAGHPERSDAAAAAERSRMAPTPTATGSPEAAHPERSDAASAAERSRRIEGWHAPEGAPEEVTAGVLARVASQRAKTARCEPARELAAAGRKHRIGTRRDVKAERCPPEEGIESVEIDWNHGSTSTR